MKLWLPMYDEHIILTSPWKIKDEYIEKEFKERKLLVCNHVCEFPVGTIIQFKSPYVSNCNTCSLTFKGGILPRQIERMHIDIEDLNGIEFEPYVKVPVKKNISKVEWNWKYSNDEIGTKVNPPSDCVINGNSAEWFVTKFSSPDCRKKTSTYGDIDYRAIIKIYADIITEQVPHFGGKIIDTKTFFIVKDLEYYVEDKVGNILGICKNKDAVRRIVNKDSEKNS